MTANFRKQQEANTVICDACLRAVPARSIGLELPAAGLEVSINGYYNGFHDEPPWEQEDFYICHDCSLKLYSFFKSKKFVPEDYRGSHYSLNAKFNEQCCEFSYLLSEDNATVIRADGSRDVYY